MLRVFLAFALAVGLSASAYAKDKAPQKTPEEVFKDLDANGDGKVTLEEFQAPVKKKLEGQDDKKIKAALKKSQKRFEQIDADKDGNLSLDELKNAPPEAKAKKKKQPAK